MSENGESEQTVPAPASEETSGPANPPPGAKSPALSRLVALIAALAAAFVMWEFLKDTPDRQSPSDRSSAGPLVGEIQSIEGQVLIRPPRGTRFEAAKAGPYQAESVLQTQAASAVVIEFRPGPTLRLLENSRLVAELDTSRDGAIQATVLTGEVTVLNPGSNPQFQLLHNGVSVDFRSGETPMPRTVPLIQVGQGADAGVADANDLEEKLEVERESEMGAAPTVDLDQAVPNATPVATAGENTDPRPKTLPAKNGDAKGLLRSTLTNDDIRSQVRAQAGSFQKCYVTMVNRMSESGVSAGALPKGEVTVSFKILPTGKVEDARILRSPFKDLTFERCAADALSRMRFRQFQGAAIPVGEFPIVLE